MIAAGIIIIVCATIVHNIMLDQMSSEETIFFIVNSVSSGGFLVLYSGFGAMAFIGLEYVKNGILLHGYRLVIFPVVVAILFVLLFISFIDICDPYGVDWTELSEQAHAISRVFLMWPFWVAFGISEIVMIAITIFKKPEGEQAAR